MGKLKTALAVIMTVMIIVLGAVGAEMNRFGESVANRTIVFCLAVALIVSWGYCLLSKDK